METTKAAAVVLPDDVLAAVLGVLPARSLAASRCVCRSWRALVDERRLLLPHVLPHSVRGLFINYYGADRGGKPLFFCRPTPPADVEDGPRADGKFDFVVDEDEQLERPHTHTHTHIEWWGSLYEVVDHCNGLVLYWKREPDVMYVCNPATRRWSRLPPLSGGVPWSQCRAFLVFDPALSPNFTVLVAPKDKEHNDDEEEVDDPCRRQMEWPPSPWIWQEFSSRTGRWEEKVFVREGDAAGTLGCLLQWRFAVYWQGSLYVDCHGEYISRLSLLNGTYTLIKSPIELAECKNDQVLSFLGRSKNGVYFAAIDGMTILRVWALSGEESIDDDQTRWVFKHQSVIWTELWWLLKRKYEKLKHKVPPWVLNNVVNTHMGDQDVSSLQQNVCSSWDSDDDDDNNEFTYVESMTYCGTSLGFLGFHPYKEVIFLCGMGHIAVACHLNSTKIECLGTLKPRANNNGVHESFVYTPCLIGCH